MADTTASPLKAQVKALQLTNNRLREQEQQYRHFFENSPIMIYVTDLNGVFLNINRAGTLLMGCQSPKEIIGKRIQDYFFKDDREFERFRQEIQNTTGVKGFETTLKTADGRERIVHLTGTMRTTALKKLKGYEGFAMDVTDRIRAEQEIRKSESQYKTILDNSLAAIYMFQNGGRFSYVNKRFLQILGYDHPEEVLGRHFWEFIAPEDQALVRERGLRREQYESAPRHYSYQMIKKDGAVIWVDMRSSHASYMGTPAAIGNFIDITTEKKAQQEIQNLSRKLIEGLEEERRSLASDLHDEFGQSLTLLQLDIERLQSLLPPGENQAGCVVKKIMDQIQTIADKIRNTTSRLRPDLLDHLGLVPTLEWYIEDFRERFQDIHVDFQAVGFKRRLDPASEIVIYRIFQEGLNNVTKHAHASKVVIKLTASHPKVIFIMKDNGKGFAQDETGMPESGTSLGIGLSSMKERTASLGGKIEIKSVPGRGTAIRVELLPTVIKEKKV